MVRLLAFLKPDAIIRSNIGVMVLREIKQSGIVNIRSMERKYITKELIDLHYAHVSTRSFYPWLIDYVAESYAVVMIFEVEERDISTLRDFLGDTLSHKAAAGTLRSRYGVYGGINCLHVSDSQDSGSKEIELWKKKLGIAEGTFSSDLESFFERGLSGIPDNTTTLRDACRELAALGVETPRLRVRVTELLTQEAPDADPAARSRLVNAIIGSCFN